MRQQQPGGGLWVVCFSGILGLACLAFGATTQPAGKEIISTKFVSGENNDNLDGTELGLATNLTGRKWSWGAGWNWGTPHINATWMGGTAQNAVDLSEEKTALAILLTSNGNYTKPAKMHIAAKLAVAKAADGGGIGFWSILPTRDDEANAATDFTGLNLKLNGDLQLFENGNAVGKPVATGNITEGEFYDLAFDVNTKTGEISNIIFNGKPVKGIESKAFTDTATAFVGAMTMSGARGSLQSLTVSAIAP